MQFDPHSVEHYTAVVAQLKTLGHDATLEYSFIGVEIDGKMWAFGTVNETWSGNTEDCTDIIETNLSIQETDAIEVAQAISEAIQEHEDTENPEFIAKVSDELTALGFKSESGSTGGGFYNVFADTTDGRKFLMGNQSDTAWGACYDENDDFGDNLKEFRVPDLPNAKKVAFLLGVELLAYEFADSLKKELSAEQWEEMRKRNVFHKTDSVCASHDFCDANMAMLQAFTVFGVKTVTDFETDTPEQLKSIELWNAAWDRAKAVYLTAETDPNHDLAIAEAARHEGFSAYQNGDTIHLQETIEKAKKAFWDVVASAYPSATTGDLSTRTDLALDAAATNAVDEWVSINVPANS